MTDNQSFSSIIDSSLFDTYLLYGIIGLLIFITLIGLILLLVTTCCWCFYSISFCFCCCHRHRHLSYKLDERFQKQENTKKISFIKHHSDDITDFSQLYDSCPHLINNKAVLKTGINNQMLDTSCTTINTLVSPTSPRGSIRSVIELAPPIQTNLMNQPFSYIKSRNDRSQISRQVKPHDRSNPPAVVSIDIARTPSSVNDTQTNSPITNIYESVIQTTHTNSSTDRATPIYETEWTHNLKRLMMNKRPLIKGNGLSAIELPTSSSPPDLVPSIHYFQQQQHPYAKFLANRKRTSDSTRRANMLQRIKDDAAFLY